MGADLFDEESTPPDSIGETKKPAEKKPAAKNTAAPGKDGERTYYCPRCRNPMRRIQGKMGPFWGCTGYPACDKKLYDKDGRPSDTPDERYRCPVCTRPLVRANKGVDKAGAPKADYWYCTGYNKGCKVTLADVDGKPTEAWRCLQCGHLLKQRRGKNGLFWGCSQYPLCTSSFPDADGKPRFPA